MLSGHSAVESNKPSSRTLYYSLDYNIRMRSRNITTTTNEAYGPIQSQSHVVYADPSEVKYDDPQSHDQSHDYEIPGQDAEYEEIRR